MDPVKVFGVAEWPIPWNKKEVQSLCWVHQLLLKVHQRLLPPCLCPVQPHQEGCQMEMGRVGAGSLQQAEGIDHFCPFVVIFYILFDVKYSILCRVCRDAGCMRVYAGG